MITHNIVLKAKTMYGFVELNSFFRSVQGIIYACIKGEILSKQAYGKVGKRTSADIDILISRKNLINIEHRLINNGLGLFTYGSIISFLNPLFILFLVISSVFTYFISKWQREYVEKHKDEWAKIDRKINYLDGLSSNFDYAKDIRLFGMLDWLIKMLSFFQKDRFVWVKKCSFRSLMGNIINALIALLREAGIYGLLIYLFFIERIGMHKQNIIRIRFVSKCLLY